MAKDFFDLIKDYSPERRAGIDALAAELMTEMDTLLVQQAMALAEAVIIEKSHKKSGHVFENFANLTKNFSPEMQARVKTHTDQIMSDKTETALSQDILKQTDLFLSTVRGFIQAMGGELHITVTFSGNTLPIKDFSSIKDEKPKEPSKYIDR